MNVLVTGAAGFIGAALSERLLGRGGTGTVFRARDRFLDIDVAIKVINRDLLSKPDVLAATENPPMRCS